MHALMNSVDGTVVMVVKVDLILMMMMMVVMIVTVGHRFSKSLVSGSSYSIVSP